MSTEGFVTVSHKKGRKSRRTKAPDYFDLADDPVTQDSKDKTIRRISEAKIELSSSDLYDSVVASLREGLDLLRNPVVGEIVCLGLGQIGHCTISRYQFALLLCLGDLYKAEIRVFDPAFTQLDREIIGHFQCEIFDSNLEGKYRNEEKSTTIFYLPHCPKQLSNNLIWANWGLNLSKCVIISNSFQSILDNSPKRILRKSAEYIFKITPHVVELAVINTFRLFEVFNDTAIHIFPQDKLSLIPTDFWDMCLEPTYSDSDLEFIKNFSNLST